MTHSLRYGNTTREVDLPDDRVDMIVAKTAMAGGGTRDTRCPDDGHLGETSAKTRNIDPPSAEASRIILEAIAGASPGLEDFLGESDSVLVVVSDHTRDTGSRIYMPLLLERIRRPGRKITILVALGLHRPSTDQEIAKILGCQPGEGVTVKNHDPDRDLALCGESLFCRDAVEAGRIILTGSVAFHPMAGYAGGRKSLLPGIASRTNIIANHRLYFCAGAKDPGVGPARLAGNPIHADICRRTAGFDDKLWCLNVVQDELKSIVFAAAGPVDKAWSACTEYLERSNSPDIARKYPVVVASSGGFPADFSFYQSIKTLTNASRACAKGGSMYLVMECRNGWELESQILEWGDLSLTEIAKRIENDFSMSGLAMYMALSIIRAYRVYCLSSLPEREIAGLGITPLASARELENLVRAENAERIALIPAAAAILPALSLRRGRAADSEKSAPPDTESAGETGPEGDTHAP